jgi:hypothetical protein
VVEAVVVVRVQVVVAAAVVRVEVAVAVVAPVFLRKV